jgi:hypothetical protein
MARSLYGRLVHLRRTNAGAAEALARVTHAQRRAVTHGMEVALRQLDERTRVYQYLIKQTVDPFVVPACAQPVAQEAMIRRTEYLNERRRELYQLAQYVVLLYEPAFEARTSTRLERFWREPRESSRKWLSIERSLELLESELENALDKLEHKAEAFEFQIADLGLVRLSRRDAFRFFRQLVNYDDVPVLAATTTRAPEAYLDYFVADSPVDCHRDHLLVGSQLVKVLSMKEPPAQTFAHILGDLLSVPGELIACLEWQRVGQERMRREIHARRRHFFNKRVSLVNYVAPESSGEEMLFLMLQRAPSRLRRQSRSARFVVPAASLNLEEPHSPVNHYHRPWMMPRSNATVTAAVRSFT